MRSSTRTRRASFIAVGLAGALALGACGSSTPGESTGGDTGDSGSTDSGDSEAPSGATEIEFWHRTFTPVENDWYANVVKQFNEAQDEVFVKGTEVPADAWDQKMKAAQAAGKAPDIYTFPGDVDESAQAGQFHDLNSLLPAEALDQIIDAAVPMAEWDGTFYAYPLLLEPQTVLFWNTEMLDAAGVDSENAPATWDDLLAACAQIQPTLSDGQFCISPAADAITMAWSTVGQQYNATGHTALNEDWTAPNIQVPGYAALIQFYKDMWDNGYMPKQDLGGYLTAKDFGEEKVAYKVSGSWMMSEVGSDYSELLDKTGLGKFPSSPDGDGRTTTTLGNFQWVIDAKAKNPEAAATFMEWVLAGDPEVMVPFFVDTQFTKVPVRVSVQEAVAGTQAAADAPWSDVIVNEIAPGAHPGVGYPWDVSVAVGTAIESGMKGAESIDGALETATKAIETIIERDDLPSKAPKN